MRFVAFSATSGTFLVYHDFGAPGGGPISEGAAVASRLFQMNQLLLQATGAADDVGVAADQAAAAAGPQRLGGPGAVDGGGGATIIGMGARRISTGSRPKGTRARLAVRQWQLDGSGEAWQLVEEPELDVVVALCVPVSWSADAAGYLARALRDAFVQAHRPQLLALASSSATSSSAATSLTLPAGSLAAAAGGPPAAAPALKPSPGGIPGLLTLQALKLLSKLTQEGMDGLLGAGLRPAWLYVAHVESFMGSHLATRVGGPAGGGGGGAGGGGAEGGEGGGAGGGEVVVGGGKKGGIFKSMLNKLGRGGGGGGKDGKGGKRTGSVSSRQGSLVESLSSRSGGSRAQLHWEAGPVGHLQHLVLRPAAQAGPDAFEWEATSIAAAVLQVKPPDEHGRGWHPPAPPPPGLSELCEGLPLAYPELEDVELELELQPPGGGPPRRFSVAGVRLAHAIAVVAQPTQSEPPPAGLSRVRLLLRETLAPMSSLFHHLAMWSSQEDIASHRMLLRLLE
ncbi:hypothetical protein HYH02_006476 [Chlamydomonas schloesseri]|uniref:Uncharacterized protein n=1 Tax=Chlamydomonas schloesseri TaxID=2026947 RepID=A0A835WJH2_9CHLO|nr:hypothetical protein HYH02_006476 [Chlamydomonas schloesseri]|eukprot:KAG2448585.1 hypothetical protein HYH02_006476 [Chlamydomonas schloesseri]